MSIEIHNNFIIEKAKITFFDIFTSFNLSSLQNLYFQNVCSVSNLIICIMIFCK